MKNLKQIIGWVQLAVKYSAVITAVIAALITLKTELEKVKLDDNAKSSKN